ncbi:MAG: restriction endonuclease subunit S [Coprococcus sp.]
MFSWLCDGATIGKLGILEIPVTTNQACCACIPYAGMNNKYLFYYLMSMRQSYIGMAEGGAQPNISKEKIVNSLIPLPPAVVRTACASLPQR